MAQLKGHTILIVEDEGLQAVDIMAALQSAGAQVIAAETLADAISSAQRKPISAAVLDIVLKKEDCTPICHYLNERRIPFFFHTAHTKHRVLSEFPHAPVLPKPATNADLLDRLFTVLRRQ